MDRSDRRHSDDPILKIGPGADPTDSAQDLLDKARMSARCEDEEQRQSVALTRRIVVAFILIMIVGGVFFVLMPYYGMNLNPIMPILAFGAIAVGALLTAPKAPKKPSCADDDGRAVGCCQGPRPLRSFREDD